MSKQIVQISSQVFQEEFKHDILATVYGQWAYHQTPVFDPKDNSKIDSFLKTYTVSDLTYGLEFVKGLTQKEAKNLTLTLAKYDLTSDDWLKTADIETAQNGYLEWRKFYHWFTEYAKHGEL